MEARWLRSGVFGRTGGGVGVKHRFTLGVLILPSGGVPSLEPLSGVFVRRSSSSGSFSSLRSGLSSFGIFFRTFATASCRIRSTDFDDAKGSETARAAHLLWLYSRRCDCC